MSTLVLVFSASAMLLIALLTAGTKSGRMGLRSWGHEGCSLRRIIMTQLAQNVCPHSKVTGSCAPPPPEQ
eukprot:CAMPEP_0182879592 /NCGR_PEP_ID=MMETSP0034_2-20130328/16069_1 /TAXON_ID=156128 /ORGANISM="Nephroselmis pyriformis, Strain CCMP717" /LENGTH=69 /DNA_ID=CAMNT_0025012543 /DNA_START=65 /DNA_END=274 /DNA_ORIENTATION=+